MAKRRRGEESKRRKDPDPSGQYDAIAELYDGYPGDYADDILFFAEEAKAAGSPVLEIGAGTGRLSFCLAAVGVDVVALDSSQPMLEVLRRKQTRRKQLPGRVWPVVGDMREFALARESLWDGRAHPNGMAEPFPLVIVPFRTFLYLLTREDQERALRAMRRHVAPDGRLILAFFVPPREIIALGRTPEQEAARFPAPEGEGEIVARGWTEFEEERQLFTQHLTYEWRDERDRYVRTLQHAMTAKYIFPEEMPPLLEACGFRVAAAYGDFDRRPLDEGSLEQIWVAVPDSRSPIPEANIMRIPIDWLNEYVPNDLSLRDLADTLTNMGLEVEAIEDTAGAAVFDIKVTPNRGDCLSVEGVARELATALRRPIAFHQPRLSQTGPPASDLAEVILDDPALCPRYSARIVRGVKIGPSPKWAQQRLERCGMRPISNIVDATNLVMLEMGQPLHAFDYRLLKGKPTIIVRLAKPGESMMTIDGEARELTPEMLVIADPSGPVAVAGVMGGASSEIHDGTTEVLLESAHFNPSVVRKGARSLGLSTEASYRFERTVDPGGTVRALDRVCELIAEFSAGAVEVAAGVVDAYPNPIAETVVALRPVRCNALLGTQLSAAEMAEHLKRLQLRVTVGDPLVVQVPTFRQDLKLEIDLIEEVARAYGYQNIPESLPSTAAGVGRQAPELVFDDQVRQVLRGLGMSETVTSSLEAPEVLTRLGLAEDDPWARPVALDNPKTQDRSQLRTNLLTSLLDVVAVNRRYGVSDVSSFDLGIVFLPTGVDSLPAQPQHLGLAGTGERWQGFWNLPKGAEQWDFFALKGVVEQVLRAVARVEAEFAPATHPAFSPTQCAQVTLGGTRLGYLGRISDAVCEAWDLPDPVYAAELDLTAIRELAVEQPSFRAPSRFPASMRDVAFVLPRGVAAGQAEQVIRESAGPDLEELRLFDVYEGKPLPEGHRNLAFSLSFRRADRTLTDEEVETAMEAVRAALREELGAAIRE